MKNKSMLYAFIVFAVFAGAIVPAAAADDPAWYIGAGAGKGNAKSASSWAGQTDAFLLTRGITSSTSIDSYDTAWKVFGGYRFNDIVAVEAAYNDLGRYSGTTSISAPAASTAPGTWDATAFSVSAVLTYPVADRFGLLVKAGLAATRLEATVSQLNTTETRVQPVFGAGVKFDFTKQFGMRAEYERFNNVGDGSTTGQSAINVWSASALYRF